MSNFFKYFPKTPYLIEDGVEISTVTNIITRIKFIDEVKKIISSYFTYDISEGETPESLAYKFYNSAQRHWIILLLNDIIDPQYGWYLNNNTLNKYVDKKYESLGGYSYAQSTTKKYLIQEKRTVNFPTEQKDTIEIRETDLATWTLVVPEETSGLPVPNYPTLTSTTTISKTEQTYYDYEFEENEKRRSIKILRPEYVPMVEAELSNMINMKIKSSI